MTAARIAAAALALNALLGLALEFGEPASAGVMAAGMMAFVALDLVALAALAAYRRHDKDVMPAGLVLWGVGLAASVYSTTWAVQLVLDMRPSYSVGIAWYHVEVFARAIGQGLLVATLVAVPRARGLAIAACAWAVLALLSVRFHLKLVDGDSFAPDESARLAREITYSGSLLVFAWIVVQADRVRRDREPPAARVVNS